MAKAFSSLCMPLSIYYALSLHRPGVSCMFANMSPHSVESRLLAVARRQNDPVKVKAESAGLNYVNLQNSSEDSQIVAENYKNNEIKMQATVPGTRTQVIFDDIFSKMVEAAQPIPGFRRIKGGKTPDIPKEVLLHILGPEKVKKRVIKKVIDLTVSEYIRKEGLKVSQNLKVVESFEELDASFEPGKKFVFNAIIILQENDPRK